MLQFLPLPALWLLFYVIGRLLSGRSLSIRQYVTAGVSLLILVFAVGIKTLGAYAAIGLVVVVLGLAVKAARRPAARRALAVISISSVTVMIGLYLGYRVYIQKFFVSLPSLSYLGFRAIAFLVSAYEGRPVSFGGGLAQMFFFPMLFMGPISRVENFEEEHDALGEVLPRLARAFPMLIGARLLEPLILDRVASAGVLPVWKLWLGAVANSFQFYWMFAGYTHLILGLGLLVGFKLPENFNNPYIATSISDFWRRWHMSLSFWIRDYVYIPLGGNRKGLLRKCANIILAMGVCGIWHGLELHYFLWGLFHGVLLSVESVCNHQNWHPLRNRLGAAYVPVKIVIIFGLVTFSWLLFKYPMPDFLAYMRGLTR
jgi:D-alanyl-lipoteichoic acid acyltransferase DltB (MBOAT superfamily)